MCDQTSAFNCRSYTFFLSSGACRLSGDDNISAGPAAVVFRQGADYYQRSPCIDRKYPHPILHGTSTPDHHNNKLLPRLPGQPCFFVNCTQLIGDLHQDRVRRQSTGQEEGGEGTTFLKSLQTLYISYNICTSHMAADTNICP